MAFYTVLLDSIGRRMIAYKATDPTSTWTAMDSIIMNDIVLSLWVWQEGSVLHIATQEQTSHRVAYHTFNTSTDAFVIENEEVINPGTKLGADSSCGISISLHSDSDVIIIYSQKTGSVDGVRYGRREAAVWTLVDLDVTNACAAGVVVRGASDRMHFFWTEPGNDDLEHRSLASDNTLDTQQTADASIDTTVIHSVGRGISYVSGANTVVKAPYLLLNNGYVTSFNSAANPTISTSSVTFEAVLEADNEAKVLLVLDGTTTHLIYIETTARDLYRDVQTDGGSWGTDIEDFDAITSNRISANIYDDGGTVIGIISQEATIVYREVSIAGPSRYFRNEQPDYRYARPRLYEELQHAPSLASAIRPPFTLDRKSTRL